MRIGVWNTAFLGDSILTLPLLQVLRKAYPDGILDFWVRSGYCSLYEEQEGFNTYGYTRAKGLRGISVLGDKIARMQYDIWITPHPSYRSAYIMKRSCARYRISYNRPWVHKICATHTIERTPHIHEVERLLSLSSPLGVPHCYVLPCYTPSERIMQEVYSLLPKDVHKKPCISLAIGAMWKTKRWLPEYYAEIVRNSVEAGYLVFLVGGGEVEEGIAQYIMQCAGCTYEVGVYSYINSPLEITAGILAQSTLCCGNDTGLMHLAWIQNIPTIALYGPTASEQGFYPLSIHSRALEVELSCRPCGMHGSHRCKEKHFQCMKNLRPEYVWHAIQDIIAQSREE